MEDLEAVWNDACHINPLQCYFRDELATLQPYAQAA